MKYLFLTLLYLIFVTVTAQNPNNETPYSVAHNLPLPQVTILPVISNTYFDTLKYIYEEDSVTHEEPNAVGQDLSKTIDQIGEIEIHGSTRIWRVLLNSESAFAVRLYLEKVKLRPMEKLFFYTLDSNNSFAGIDGAYTEFHNSLDSYFVSPLYVGSRLIMEYNGPSTLELPTFKLSYLLHGFRKQSAGVNNETLSCHNDVNCSPENPWCNEIRSVCKITVAKNIPIYKNRVTGELLETRVFSWNGSGAVLNNSNNDFRPLILTARHVIRAPSIYVARTDTGDDTGYEDTFRAIAHDYVDFERTVFDFNFQHRECDNGFDFLALLHCATSKEIDIHFRERGCKFLEDESGVLGCDLALLEMTNKPPLQFNVYYAGWDRHKISDIEGNDVTGIHHPNGDLKKISHGEIDRNLTGTSAKVAVDWSSGVTEFGSSGSPLFRNDTRRVIGGLSWGDPNTSCDPWRDRYGKLRSFWGKVNDELSPDDDDRNWLAGNDPLGACQNNLELNSRFLPSSIYRLAKPDILIQAGQNITIANKEKTEIINLCIGSQTFNSNYTFAANGSISIKGNAGFSIQSGATVSLRIQPCSWFGSCEQNYYSSAPPLNIVDSNTNWNVTDLDSKEKVYPNPTNGALVLKVMAENPIISCEVYNSIGTLIQTIYTVEGQNQIFDVPLESFSKGIYTVRFRRTDGSIGGQQFIID